MSILIKGVKMPKNCDFCILKDLCDFSVPFTKRPSDCPLIEVPPHGRLIDADELRKKYFCGENVRHDLMHISAENILHFIDHAPTVIESEEK